MVIVVMGVSGAGKTAIGRALASATKASFVDADDLHSAANVAKMRSGAPLDDDDRAPWLAAVRAVIARWLDDATDGVVACSALKQSYRDTLMKPHENVHLVYLRADRATLERRLRARSQHFMPASLLDSQLSTLEPPTDAIVVDAARPIDEVVRAIVSAVM